MRIGHPHICRRSRGGVRSQTIQSLLRGYRDSSAHPAMPFSRRVAVSTVKVQILRTRRECAATENSLRKATRRDVVFERTELSAVSNRRGRNWEGRSQYTGRWTVNTPPAAGVRAFEHAILAVGTAERWLKASGDDGLVWFVAVSRACMACPTERARVRPLRRRRSRGGGAEGAMQSVGAIEKQRSARSKQ
eukprot:scaffold28499_cov35-Tisochrysis_lutea.AAC.2